MYDCTAAAACDGRSRILVRRILLSIPKLPRLAAIEDPGADVTRRPIEFAQERDALFCVGDIPESPFRLCDLCGLCGERSRERHHFVAKRNFVFQITAIQRLCPHERRRLIGAPAKRTRSGLNAGERNSFTARPVGDFPDDDSFAIEDLDILSESIHREKVRDRPLDFRDQEVLAVRRRCDFVVDRRLPDGCGARALSPRCGRLRAGHHTIHYTELAREVVGEEFFVVRGLDHVLIRSDLCGFAVALLHIRSGRHRRRGRRKSAA